MPGGSPKSRPERILWMLLLATALPMAVVLGLAIHAVLKEVQSELERERNHLKFMAALRARELDSLPALVGEVLDEVKPVQHLAMTPPPPLPGERPLLRRFFVLNADTLPVLPRLPYLPTPTRKVATTPFLLHLSSPEAFTPLDESSAPSAESQQLYLWIEEYQKAEDLAKKGEKRQAMGRFQSLATETGSCYFSHWVKFRWAQVAETLAPPPVDDIEIRYLEITQGTFRELAPDHPLRLNAAFCLAKTRWMATGSFAPLFDFLKALYSDTTGNECSRKGYEAVLEEVKALLAKPEAPELPEEVRRLRAEVSEKIHLVELILPGLVKPGKDPTFTPCTLPGGNTAILVHRKAPSGFLDSEYSEGGILDLASPRAPLARETTPSTPGSIAFAVIGPDGSVLSGRRPPEGNPLLEEVACGPGNLFRIRAFHPGPNTFQTGLNQYRFWLLAFISMAALAAMAGGYLAYRSLGRELELTRLKTEFIAGVSHELRTPLTTIQMFGETLQLGRVKDVAQTKRYYDAINEEAARLRRLIDDLLDFGRMEAGRAVLSTSMENPRAVAQSALSTFARTPEGRRREVVFHPQCPPQTEVLLDSGAVERALLNLLTNAAKYSEPDTPIRLTLRLENSSLIYRVKDQGKGIPGRYHRRIFDKFFRIPDVKTREVGGTGLGLALVHQIALAHGGSVAVESTPGRGSCFTLVLPGIPEA